MKHTIVVNGYYIDVFKSDDGYIGKVRNLENCFTEGKDFKRFKIK
ncbi:hypothetical protein [Gottschalkia acidurici]|nr:hypothetical protein [Gottschalkia acidurici]